MHYDILKVKITGKCNRDCAFCVFHGSGYEMDMDTYMRFLEKSTEIDFNVHPRRGEYLLLEFRRNGRRVDGCEYLGILPKPAEFRPPHEPSVDVVCRVCGLNERMRLYIDSCPDAEEIWSRLRSKLENTRVRYSP